MVVPQQNALAICQAALADSKGKAATKRLSKAVEVLSAAVEKVNIKNMLRPASSFSACHESFWFFMAIHSFSIS